MNVLIDDLFTGITPAEYESLYFDEDFNRAVGKELRMGRLLLHFERRPDRIVRKVQFEPEHDPDSPAKQAFGTSRSSFIEELDYDPRIRRGTWRAVPNLFADRATNAGTIEFIDAPNGMRRIVRGEVKVKLFGFGRLIERIVVGEITKNYAATTRFTTDWIAKR